MKRLLCLLAAVWVCGCLSQIVSFEDYTKNWIGRPVFEKKKIMARPESHASQIGWKNIEYNLQNGNTIFVEPDRPDCFIHWEVDPNGIIIGYRAVGLGCK